MNVKYLHLRIKLNMNLNFTILKVVIAVFLMFGMMQACTHDPILSESYTSNTPIFKGDCNSETVYFERDIAPILNANCATSNCHNSSTAKDGVDYSSYTQVIATGGVEPFNAAGSEMIEVINETDDDQMPPLPANQLHSSSRALIKKWIDQGAYNYSCAESGICDSVNMSYINDIVPLLNLSCTGCHSGSAPDGGVSLNTYADVLVQVNNGKLMGTIKHESGFVAMPQNGAKWDDCEVAMINNWINEGALEN